MGTDLVKDPAVLEAAYDDRQGVTAEFNRNLLHVLNRELDADFDPADFEHVARFDAGTSGSKCACARGASIRLRYGAGSARALRRRRGDAHRDQRQVHARARDEDLADAGLELVRWLTDPDEQFALTLSAPAG